MQTFSYILYGILLAVVPQNIKTNEAVFSLPEFAPLLNLKSTETNKCDFREYSSRLLLKSLSDLDYIQVTNAVDIVRTELLNTLDLPDLQFSILQAKGLTHGILFEMATPEDASVLLQKYKLQMQNEVPMNYKFQSENQLEFNAQLIDKRIGSV